jgi:hypothetical protein
MKVCPKEHLATIKSFQKDEATASLLYLIMAKSIKDKKNRRIMLKMAKEE